MQNSSYASLRRVGRVDDVGGLRYGDSDAELRGANERYTQPASGKGTCHRLVRPYDDDDDDDDAWHG